MQTSIYLLILISLLAGFCMRPFNMLVFGAVFSLSKYTRSKSQVIMMVIASALTTATAYITSVFLALKLTGLLSMAGVSLAFPLSFFAGVILWIIYAQLFNRSCRVDLEGN